MSKRKRKKPGAPPGSLVYTGNRIVSSPNITLLQFNQSDLRQQMTKDSLPEPEAGPFVNWFDIRGLNNVPLLEKIGRKYNIHPLALEDILDTDQRPKLEDYNNSVFLIVKAMHWDKENLAIRSEQVALFISENLVLSFQEDEDDLFIAIRERLVKASGKIRQRGADYLAYALVDNIVDHYYTVLDQIEEKLEQLELQILAKPERAYKSQIHRTKLATLRMRKTAGPTREAISRLYKIDHPVFREETAVFVRDLYDHIAQVTESIENYRDITNGIYDLYLSEINFKTNNIVQVLTIISTIFLPLTFLVGVYGMNFKYMPELEWRYGYFFLWGIMLLIFLLGILYFKKRNWL